MISAKTYYDEYNTMNFKETLLSEGMEIENKDYVETDNQVIIYLFRGSGCGFCARLLSYLNSISTEYGKYFKVVSFEVWNDTRNSALLNKMPSVTNVAAQGVPYYIIGEKVFDGYNETYNQKIIDAIMDEYKNPTEDIFSKLEKSEKKANSGETDTFAIIFWNLIFIIIASGVNIYLNNKNKKEILEALEKNKVNNRNNDYKKKNNE